MNTQHMKKEILTFGFLLITILIFGQQTKYVDAEELNIRTGSGTKFEIVEKISQGQKVTVLSEQGKWSEIELENGQKGFVSTKFLSDNANSKNSTNKISWITYLILFGLLLYGLSNIKNIFSSLFGFSLLSSKPKKQNPIKKQDLNNYSRKNVVYRYRIKGNGNAGGVKYVDGMYIEIAVSGLGADTPFNNILEKLFVQEFAKKYNIEPRSYSGIKMLYKRQYLEVEII